MLRLCRNILGANLEIFYYKKKQYYFNDKKFFFDQDCSSLYMVPLDLKSEWNRLNTNDEDDYDTIDEFNRLFSQYIE